MSFYQALFNQLRLFLEETHGYWYDEESGEFDKLVPGVIQRQRTPKDRREARRMLLQSYFGPAEELDDGLFLIRQPKEWDDRRRDVFLRQFDPSTLDDPRLRKALPLLETELADARQKALALCGEWGLHFPDSFGVGPYRAEAEGRERYVYTAPGPEEVDSPERAREREDYLLERLESCQRRLENCEARGGEGTMLHQSLRRKLEKNRGELETLREKWGLSQEGVKP